MGQSGGNPLGEPTIAGDDEVAGALDKILQKWPEIEMALERSGRSDQLVTDLQGYISDLRSDAETVRKLRTLTMATAGAYILFSNLLLVCLIFYHQVFFLMLGTYGKTALIIAVFSSSVILIAKVLAGLFRTYGDRNKDEVLPPHIQTAFEVFRATQN